MSHPHRVTREGGADVDETPSWSFVVLQYFEKILPLVESLWCAQQNEAYMMGCSATGGPFTSSKMAAILAAFLHFTPN